MRRSLASEIARERRADDRRRATILLPKLKLFHKGDVVEVQTRSGKVVVKWTGFDGSDFPVSMQVRFARAFVRAVNATPEGEE